MVTAKEMPNNNQCFPEALDLDSAISVYVAKRGQK